MTHNTPIEMKTLAQQNILEVLTTFLIKYNLYY